jgi:hypothetical protein
VLNAKAPQIRTAEALIEKHEQIFDGLEHGAIENKRAEQMNQALKGIMGVERLGLQYLSQMMKYGRKIPVPRTPVLRNLLGLPEHVSASDGEQVRALLPEK